MANGEKVPPGDMESAIAMDELISQVMVVGEGRAFLGALVVLDPDRYAEMAQAKGLGELGADKNSPALKKLLLNRIKARLTTFPGYAKIQRVAVVEEPWTIETGLLTPTLKPKRAPILEACAAEMKELYGDN